MALIPSTGGGNMVNVDLALDSGTATTGTTTTLTDSTKDWETNIWIGSTIEITNGTSEEVRTISDNTGTKITVDTPFTNSPTTSTTYKIYGIANSDLAREGGNLANLDVALSTIATESTLAAIKSALASIGTDKLLTTPDNPSNLDVALSVIRDLFSPVSAQGSVTAANNTGGLVISIDVDGRPTVELYYDVSDAATINIYGSSDGTTWRYTSSITIPAADENGTVFNNGFKYVKVECVTTGIDITLEVSAAR